jgi:hypothetical protein
MPVFTSAITAALFGCGGRRASSCVKPTFVTTVSTAPDGP